jgi:hypothetical protein
MTDGLTPERVFLALARPGFGDELGALGVRDVSGFGPNEVLWPPENEARIMEIVELSEGALTDDKAARSGAQGIPGRPRVTITEDTLFNIFRQSLERARSTSKPAQPSYEAIAATNEVGRTWVTPVVKWAVAHQLEARQAIALSETPERFSTIVRD